LGWATHSHWCYFAKSSVLLWTFGLTNCVLHYSCYRFVRYWVVKLEQSISCECGLDHFSLAVYITELVRCDNWFTLADTKVLLNNSFAAIALLRAVSDVSADAICVPFLSCITSLVDHFLAVWKTIFVSFSTVCRHEAWLAHAGTHISQVLAVKPSTFTWCWADVSFRLTKTFHALGSSVNIPKGVFRAWHAHIELGNCRLIIVST